MYNVSFEQGNVFRIAGLVEKSFHERMKSVGNSLTFIVNDILYTTGVSQWVGVRNRRKNYNFRLSYLFTIYWFIWVYDMFCGTIVVDGVFLTNYNTRRFLIHLSPRRSFFSIYTVHSQGIFSPLCTYNTAQITSLPKRLFDFSPFFTLTNTTMNLWFTITRRTVVQRNRIVRNRLNPERFQSGEPYK